MTPFERHLSAASGYLELGLPLEANGELEEIDAMERADWRVLDLRLGIYQGLGAWELMGEVAQHLAATQPDEPKWAICLSHATRQAGFVEVAYQLLLTAKARFPMESTIRFNLACCMAQMGNLSAAINYLKEAIQLNPSCREMAQQDEDLKPLWEELRDGRL